MNAKRKIKLEALMVKISDIKQAVSEILEEEEEAFGNLPENLQSSERADAMADAINSLREVENSLDEAETTMEEILNR
jgi:uncharacterized protein YoxC